MPVSREEKKNKYSTWHVYFAAKSSAPAKKAFKKESGTTVQYVAASKTRVDLIWPRPVTHDSPRLLCIKARAKLSSFEIFGNPRASLFSS